MENDDDDDNQTLEKISVDFTIGHLWSIITPYLGAALVYAEQALHEYKTPDANTNNGWCRRRGKNLINQMEKEFYQKKITLGVINILENMQLNIPTAVVLAKSLMKGIWLFSNWYLQATRVGL